MHHPDGPLDHTEARSIFPYTPDFNGVFSPDELGRLQEMFDAARQSCRIFGEGDSSEALGRAVIRLYKNGVRKPAVAAHMLLRAFGTSKAVAIR